MCWLARFPGIPSLKKMLRSGAPDTYFEKTFENALINQKNIPSKHKSTIHAHKREVERVRGRERETTLKCHALQDGIYFQQCCNAMGSLVPNAVICGRTREKSTMPDLQSSPHEHLIKTCNEWWGVLPWLKKREELIIINNMNDELI